MLNEEIERIAGARPVLPESLRQAVREAEATGRRAEERAQLAMPFRARLRARDAVRPQSTLAILADADQFGDARYARGKRRDSVAGAALPAGFGLGAGSGSGDDDAGGVGPRMNDVSQFAFAGLAVLGLAGLSVMAAESALNPSREGGIDAAGAAGRLAELDFARLGTEASVSANALASAAGDALTPAAAPPVPWFDYRGFADQLQARIAAHEEAERAAARIREADAERMAAAAIADAEAARLADAAAAEIAAADSQGAEAAAAARVLADAEAARLAEAETQRLADRAAADAAARAEAERLASFEAERLAASQLEVKRLADLQAQQAAEAETRRLAEIEARRVSAEAEAKRLAALETQKANEAAEAKRIAALEAKQAADAEAKRLAAFEAKQAADAAEAQRLAALAARRAADAEAQRVAAAAVAQPAVQTAAAPPRVPRPASRKPVRTETPVSRIAPQTLTAANPVVRSFETETAATSVRAVDAFLAERVQRTASSPVSDASLEGLRTEFLRLVASSADGSRHVLTTPDGRELRVTFEKTVPVEAARANVRTIDYRIVDGSAIERTFAEPARVTVSVMCRDVAYAFPGQERGRFAACEGADGTWTLARASEPAAQPA